MRKCGNKNGSQRRRGSIEDYVSTMIYIVEARNRNSNIKMTISEKDKLEPMKNWHFMKPGPRRCPDCPDGFIISTKRLGENVFVDRCSSCGKIHSQYKVDPR
jgi:hypothetical protein